MKIKLFWKLAIILFFVSFPYLAESTTILRLPGGFTISNMVKHSHLVFTGEVIDLEFVYREGNPPVLYGSTLAADVVKYNYCFLTFKFLMLHFIC